MSQVQSGILPEHCRAAIWIEANLKGDVNALREASKILSITWPPSVLNPRRQTRCGGGVRQ